MAQRRSVSVALDYVTVLASGVKANCWSLAESAGHDGQGRMQGLLGSYRWDWTRLRDQLPGLAAAWIPDAPQDLIGPGIAIDETAQLKKGDATACVAPQHAGCTGTVENCVTTVFCAYVTANGQAWVDFDVYMPQRWASDAARRRAAGIPDELPFATKPQLAMNQLDRQVAAGSPARWVAFDEVYGRSEPAAQQGRRARPGLCGDHPVRLPDPAALGRGDPRRSGRPGRGVRAPVLRERLQRTPLQRLGHDRHRGAGAVPADPAAALAPGQLHLLPVLGPTRPPGHHDLLHHHRRAPLAGRDNLRDRQGRVRLGPDPGPQPGRDLSAHRPGRPRPTPRRRHPQHDHRQHHPASRHRHRHRAPARRTPAPRPATATATATARSATPTCRSPSATRPSRSAPANPAHPSSARSSCPSPKPPG